MGESGKFWTRGGSLRCALRRTWIVKRREGRSSKICLHGGTCYEDFTLTSSFRVYFLRDSFIFLELLSSNAKMRRCYCFLILFWTYKQISCSYTELYGQVGVRRKLIL